MGFARAIYEDKVKKSTFSKFYHDFVQIFVRYIHTLPKYNPYFFVIKFG